VTELASTMTPCEIASQAAHAITVLNELTHGGGELTTIQQEDGQLEHEQGLEVGDTVTEVIEALAAAGQAADMMTAALAETRAASAQLTPARARGAEGKRGSDAR
jgi:hypothetical protein